MARNVFVTGATSGIGLCIAEAYAKYGDNVLISGRRAEVLAEVQARLSKEYGVRVETLLLEPCFQHPHDYAHQAPKSQHARHIP